MRRHLLPILILASILGILALIAAPNFQKLREKSYDASAQSSGRSAKLAAEVYFQEHQHQGYGYTSALSDLLVHDKNLTDDRDVTFIWGYAGDANYTFTTKHAKSGKTFVFSGGDAGGSSYPSYAQVTPSGTPPAAAPAPAPPAAPWSPPPYPVVPPYDESYAPIREAGFASVATDPLSTFSIDVDTASYSNVRRFVQSGQKPPRDAVRIEELLNYFAYDDRPPVGDDPFSVTAEVASCPWNAANRLMRVGLRGRSIPEGQRPPANLVFLLDVSGSMQDANKLPLVQEAFRLLAGRLSALDTVAIVTYADATQVVLPPTRGSQTRTIRKAIDALVADGRTNGEAGLHLAYTVAVGNYREDGINRVILATDGDFNVGVTGEDALEEMIRKKARAGVFLTAIGVGMGNLQDARIERLADKGNGHYAYVDDLDEARKVFDKQITATLVPIAKDVKVQVEFNPAKVAGYRLIGYENRALAPQDFHDDTKDAGEIGAGHAVTALYEIVPAGQKFPTDDRLVDALKYRTETPSAAAKTDQLATVKLAYKAPDAGKSRYIEVTVRDVPGDIAAASSDLRFAASVAAFGMLLRESDYKGAASWEQVLALAKGAIGPDRDGRRAEFVRLARQAMTL